MSYHSNATTASIGAFNKKNKVSNFAKLVKLTFERTYSALGFNAPSVPLASWLMSLPSELGRKLYAYWLKVPTNVANFYNEIYS